MNFDFHSKAKCSDCTFKCLLGFIKDEDIFVLDKGKTELDYQAGDIIIKQGSYVAQILYVKSGLVKAIIEEKNKRNTVLKIVPPGNFVVLPVLGKLKIYPVSVVAISDAALCLISKETVLKLISDNPRISNELVDWYSMDYTYLYSRISTLSTRNSHGKLATALLYLSDEQFEGTNVFNYISRKDLADLASISLESTNKILQELKNDRIIEIENRNIQVLRPELLRTLSTIG